MHAELLAARDPAVVDRYWAPDFHSHDMPPGLPQGPEGVKRFLAQIADALPDADVSIDVLLSDGDLVAVHTTTTGTHRGRLFGLPPTGRRLAMGGSDIVRIADGRIVEHWGLTDVAGVVRQAGPLATARGALHHLLRR